MFNLIEILYWFLLRFILIRWEDDDENLMNKSDAIIKRIPKLHFSFLSLKIGENPLLCVPREFMKIFFQYEAPRNIRSCSRSANLRWDKNAILLIFYFVRSTLFHIFQQRYQFCGWAQFFFALLEKLFALFEENIIKGKFMFGALFATIYEMWWAPKI